MNNRALPAASQENRVNLIGYVMQPSRRGGLSQISANNIRTYMFGTVTNCNLTRCDIQVPGDRRARDVNGACMHAARMSPRCYIIY